MKVFRGFIVGFAFLFVAGLLSEALAADNSVRSITTVVARAGRKRVVKVVLNNKVSKEDLRFYAAQIKNGDSNFYKNTFIDYVVLGQGDTWSWATTHFMPDLEVKILGLSLEQEKILIDDPKRPQGEIVGAWLMDGASISRLLTLYREKGQLKMERKYPDLSADSVRMVMERIESFRGLVFTHQDAPDSKDQYRIIKGGDMELWDKDGLVMGLKRVR